jgi:hypothetical protein
VGHEHAAVRARRVLQQRAHDVLVRQTVKTIAAHALLRQRLRQGKRAGHIGQPGVKGGVKTRHLHHVRKRGLRRADARQVMGLVQGRKG